MDLLGWCGLVVLFSWWLRVSSADVMGRKFLYDLHGASPVLLETGFWDIVLCVWAILAIIAILAISMARYKNTGKGKAPSSSVERAVKKRKSDTSQTVRRANKSEEIRLLRVRRHRRAMMRRSRPCLLRLLIQNRKNGPNRLQRGDFIARGV